MEVDLIDRGYLKRPVIYFDESIIEGMGKAEVTRLTKIAIKFGASVTEDVNDVASGKVTHIVAYDPEEHDTKEVIEEEERREKALAAASASSAGGGAGEEDTDKTYLKTLAIVNQPLPDGSTKPMALVHWWYHPSSYDEWMSAEDVSNVIESEAEQKVGIPNGPAVVGCKFVRDVERFNEWGVESDYAVME